MNSTPRNFDFFRVGHSVAKVDVSPMKLREWAKRPDGPKLYRMNDQDFTWMRYSEVEAFIAANSTIKVAA